jgi:hypothetical protein
LLVTDDTVVAIHLMYCNVITSTENTEMPVKLREDLMLNTVEVRLKLL